jgi:hypothetical protein
MTCSTSAVAVCCSRASVVSLNRRTFSIAISAWSANDLGVAERPWRLAPEHQHADTLAVAHHRHHQRRGHAARGADSPFPLGKLDSAPIGQVQHPARREHARREVVGRVDRRVAGPDPDGSSVRSRAGDQRL